MIRLPRDAADHDRNRSQKNHIHPEKEMDDEWTFLNLQTRTGRLADDIDDRCGRSRRGQILRDRDSIEPRFPRERVGKMVANQKTVTRMTTASTDLPDGFDLRFKLDTMPPKQALCVAKRCHHDVKNDEFQEKSTRSRRTSIRTTIINSQVVPRVQDLLPQANRFQGITASTDFWITRNAADFVKFRWRSSP